MRIPMIAGNWKMNTTVEDAVRLVKTMLPKLAEMEGVEKVVCPPFVSLTAVKDVIEGSPVKLGAQNIFYKDKGAYTGEIAPLMLAGLCEYVIVGHSERRQYFGETDEIVNKKVEAAVENLLKPILCIGETLEENEAGRTEEVLTRQFMACSNRLYFFGGMVIAYEPVWAIGTGKSATSDEANNIGELMKKPEIDGALVGGASLKADEFVKIVEQTLEVRGFT
jgi:triosephosphate isomerase